MKLLISAAALLLLLTPGVAQQAEQSAPDRAQQTSAGTSQPAAEQHGMSQADALAAAQDEEQYPEAQGATDANQEAQQGQGQQDQVQQDQVQQDQGQDQGRPPADAADAAAAQPYPNTDTARRLPERRELQVSPAIRPRANAAAYPVYREQRALSIGAKLLSANEVEDRFSTPLGKHYLVVEVGIFPAGAVQLRPNNFTLRPAGSEDQAFFPAAAEDIASAMANSGPGSRRVRIIPGFGIGYESGPWNRGVSTGVGVGVDGGPRPYARGPMGANRRVIENELRDKSLPEGTLDQPTAGYLYFPVQQRRNAHYNLEFNWNGETLSLPLLTPRS